MGSEEGKKEEWRGGFWGFCFELRKVGVILSVLAMRELRIPTCVDG